MKLSKNLKLLVRIRDYETAHIEVGAEISHFDLGYDDEDWAGLTDSRRNRFTEDLHGILNAEVDRIAREELTVIAGWSEISPNLAEDFLSVEPPTTVQRNQHATSKKIGTQSASSGGIRRASTSTTAKPA